MILIVWQCTKLWSSRLSPSPKQESTVPSMQDAQLLLQPILFTVSIKRISRLQRILEWLIHYFLVSISSLLSLTKRMPIQIKELLRGSAEIIGLLPWSINGAHNSMKMTSSSFNPLRIRKLMKILSRRVMCIVLTTKVKFLRKISSRSI